MKKVRLSNDFHHSDVIVIPRDGKLSARQRDRADRALCYRDCICGGPAGTRGDQVQMDGSVIVVAWDCDEHRKADIRVSSEGL